MTLRRTRRAIDHFLSSLARPEKLVILNQAGRASPSDTRLCLFSHFDLRDHVSPYVFYHLERLRELGADIVFISTCASLPAPDLDRLKGLCIRVVLRKNLSLDFGSWKIGLGVGPELSRYDQLILANDSVYGPFFPLAPIFEKMNGQGCDFWGITSTTEIRPHIQSYFLVFSPRAFLSEAFKKFWEDFRYYRSKARIIENYELGFSMLAQKEKWKTGAYVESTQLRSQGPHINPTLHAWKELIEEWKCPFLKTEVLRLNRTASPDVREWAQILAKQSTYPIEQIREHLSCLPSKR